MPTVPNMVQSYFELRRNIQSQTYLGGTALGIERGPALWATEYRLALGLTRSDADPFLAWLDNIGTGRFLAYDLLRCRPRAHLTTYPGGFSGTGTISARTTTSVTIGNVVSGLALRAGDMISLVTGSARSLHRVTANVTSSGTSMTVSVTPAVRTAVHSSGSVVLTNPSCLMMLNGQPSIQRDGNRETITFQAVQVFG
jgi:hypothetical protein